MGKIGGEPLLLSRLIDFAAENAGATEVVGRNIDGHIERCTWFELRRRALRLAKAFAARGDGMDSRIGALAWNTIDHVAVCYAALGIGASLHTINPRLTPRVRAWIHMGEGTTLPDSPLPNLISKAGFVDGHDDDFA